ncbi:hypothetical protein B0I35DRAFT_409500 [Stachybotrys elegans]|uniref:Uncharacterized protein n=1 Tax=Stachybotrys elegans TaxID=80388 RepID=A0A8K0SRR3_9HYPO|nr:hypothetical protein B0I35DRAFT_409500 [Stachybotrys elegans]
MSQQVEPRKQPTAEKVPWNQQPGLLPYDGLSGIRAYSAGRPVSQPPRNIRKTFLTSDAIIVAVDFETLCRQKLTSDGLRYAPVTEIGMAWLDTRRIRPAGGMGYSHPPRQMLEPSRLGMCPISAILKTQATVAEIGES